MCGQADMCFLAACDYGAGSAGSGIASAGVACAARTLPGISISWRMARRVRPCATLELERRVAWVGIAPHTMIPGVSHSELMNNDDNEKEEANRQHETSCEREPPPYAVEPLWPWRWLSERLWKRRRRWSWSWRQVRQRVRHDEAKEAIADRRPQEELELPAPLVS